MQYKLLALAAMASSALAQDMMNLTAALSGTPELSNLTSYVQLFPELLTQLSAATNITILAPSNDAFTALLESPMGAAITANDTGLIAAVLSYHVLNGTYPASAVMEDPAFIPTMLMDPMYSNVTGGQRVEAVKMGENVMFYSGLLMNSTVTTADVNFTGGVIHIIDSVLVPPQNISTTAVAAGLSSAAGALTSAELVEMVDTAMDLTVFVPNNAAFQAIGSALPNLTMEQITSILQYHVVSGTVGYSSVLEDGMMLTTMGGGNVTITIAEGGVFVNSAKVVLPDVLVANGVVHVIDNVLNPEMSMATPEPTASMQSVAFSGASSGTEAPYTSGVPTPTAAIGGDRASSAMSPMSTAGGAASSSSSAAAMPMKTAAVGAAALFGAGAAFLNY
ncbi:MAG: hypothetical protein M1817_001330 [Caeruleum heppii]|nr:MAG: hypothetical protein M1817_001330 [Caeruleum heppii]